MEDKMTDLEAIYRKKLIEQKKRTIVARKEKVEIQNKLIQQLEIELDLLEKIEELKDNTVEKELQKKILILEKENREIKRKYEALSKSKLGRLTLKYWSTKKGLMGI